MPTPPVQLVVFIYVKDLLESHRFYSNILGLDLTLDQGSCRIYKVTPTSFIGLCTSENKSSSDNIILTLVSNDLESWAKHLEENGVYIEKKPTFNEKYNITHLFCRDPDNYRIEIQLFHDSKWPNAAE